MPRHEELVHENAESLLVAWHHPGSPDRDGAEPTSDETLRVIGTAQFGERSAYMGIRKPHFASDAE
jgi:hypothetical protein